MRDDEYLRGFIVKMLILFLEIVNFLLQQLDIEAPQFKRRRILNVVGIDVKQIRLHLKINRNMRRKNFFRNLKLDRSNSSGIKVIMREKILIRKQIHIKTCYFSRIFMNMIGLI